MLIVRNSIVPLKRAPTHTAINMSIFFFFFLLSVVTYEGLLKQFNLFVCEFVLICQHIFMIVIGVYFKCSTTCYDVILGYYVNY